MAYGRFIAHCLLSMARFSCRFVVPELRCGGWIVRVASTALEEDRGSLRMEVILPDMANSFTLNDASLPFQYYLTICLSPAMVQQRVIRATIRTRTSFQQRGFKGEL